jgi:hypothetical protein
MPSLSMMLIHYAPNSLKRIARLKNVTTTRGDL